MVLAAPELVIAEIVELLHEIEVAAELQHRMLADRMMRGEEGSEFEARHDGVLPGGIIVLLALRLEAGGADGNRRRRRNGWRNAAMRSPWGLSDQVMQSMRAEFW